jgi:hypothetical protein
MDLVEENRGSKHKATNGDMKHCERMPTVMR